MKKAILIILSFLMLVSAEYYAERKSTGCKSSFKLKTSYSFNICKIILSTSYKLPKVNSTNNYNSPSNKIGLTKYNHSATYKYSGFPTVVRSNWAKRESLESRGYSKTPRGYEVGSIMPLPKGGQDAPSNMQFFTKKIYVQKTIYETNG